MSSITISHEDPTIWTMARDSIRRLSGGGLWIPFAAPPGIIDIAAGKESDDLWALQTLDTNTALLQRKRAAVQTLTGSGTMSLTELSVGNDGTLCGLIDGDPCIYTDEGWERLLLPACVAISVFDQNRVWFVTSEGEVGATFRENGPGSYETYPGVTATWISAAADGTVLVTTPTGVYRWQKSSLEPYGFFAPLPHDPVPNPQLGLRVVCGSKDFIYASDIANLWYFNGAEWDRVDAPGFWRIGVSPDGGVVGGGSFNVFRRTTFGWEILPDLASGLIALQSMEQVWSFSFMGLGDVTYWPGTTWTELEAAPVSTLAAGSDDEIWGIDTNPEDPGLVFRRDPQTLNWIEMPGPMNAISVGSANFVAALDRDWKVRLWDPQGKQWGEPIKPPPDVSFRYVGIGDDGTLMASGNSVAYALLQGQWQAASQYPVVELQVADQDHACGYSGGDLWVGGAPADPSVDSADQARRAAQWFMLHEASYR